MVLHTALPLHCTVLRAHTISTTAAQMRASTAAHDWFWVWRSNFFILIPDVLMEKTVVLYDFDANVANLLKVHRGTHFLFSKAQ